jgi:hypothetical protein
VVERPPLFVGGSMGTDIHGYLEVYTKSGWTCKEKIPDNRDCDWFGVLSGTENMVNTKPISMPRGIPANTSTRVIRAKDSFGDGAFDSSWLNLKDFMEHDWDFKSLDGRESIMSPEGIEVSKAWYNNHDYIRKEYSFAHLERTAIQLIESNWMRFLARMERLGKKHGPEGVRIVFWFTC